ncbi:jg11603 [Pararge aegeria aegeria]|uniref:Jg11603 protein n=1 Tax=Pararge aegeria aegeria TaxID=348720 RepID=A0A8S4RUR9_9NEOP|nr:jg11603 [Pararge aegeria aegeria]
MLGLSLRQQISNVEIRRRKNQSYRHGSTSRESEVAMGGVHSSEKGWTLGSQGARMAAPPLDIKNILRWRIFT